MAFIDFTNGEVLTADQMDTTFRQTVMRFADASARDTALSGVLAEGMLAYLDSTKEVLKYDGSQWIDISGDISGVTAGTALTGGGTSGNVTLDVDTAAVGSAIGIDSKQDNVITTQGDLIIGDASGDPVRLPVGSVDQVLTSDGTTVSFQDAGGGGGAVAYEALSEGTYTVSIDAGVYAVASEGAYPIIIGGQEIQEATTFLKLDSAATSLEFQNNINFDNFIERTLPNAPFAIQGIAFGNSIYVAVGSTGYIATSPDGITWTERSSGTSAKLNHVAFGDGLFVVAGDDFSGSPRLITSPDGITWTNRTVPNFSSDLDHVSFGDGLFIVIGDSYAATSTDGINWTERTVPNIQTRMNASTFGNGLYFIFGNSGYIASSPDGTTWTQRNVAGTNNDLDAAAFGDGTFVVAGNGFVATSTDGISWTEGTLGTSDEMRDVDFASGTFMLVGGNSGNTYAATSPDGITWTQRVLPNSGDLYSIFIGDLAIAGGSTGYIASAIEILPQYLILTAAEVETLS